ncbi:MAG: alpha-2-macroglobulin family protein [Endomicrobia bacterium]|nr:alpha-2-macroglobulin family protein [Endomicrobiia bacterium]
MKNRISRAVLIAFLVVFVFGAFLVKRGYVYFPSASEMLSKPVKALRYLGIGKKKESQQYQDIYRDSNLYIYPPNITRVQENSKGEAELAKPDPLSFYFNSSAANIELVGKEVSGISMSPKFEGTWKWENQYMLVFTPAQDWPAGETYKIKFPREIFNSELNLTTFSYEVRTPAFRASLYSFGIYQDPKNPRIHQLQAVFSFTHSVDTKLFEKNLELTIDKKRVTTTISYDAVKRTAYVVSDPIKILAKDQTAVIELSSVKAATGGKAMADKIRSAIDIPSEEKFFRISDARTVIVRNDKEEPEQFLEIAFTTGVEVSEMEGKVELYLLPLRHPTSDKNSSNEYDYDNEYDEGYYDEYDNYIEPQRTTRPVSYRWSFPEVTPEILEKSEKLNLELMPTAESASSVFMYRYFAPDLSRRYVYVKVKEGIKSQIDFTTKKPYANVLVSAEFPKEVKLLQNGAILPLEGSKRLTFVTRGVSGVKVDLARVMPNQINHLISQTYGTFANPYFSNYNFNENNISQMFSKVIPLKVSVSKANYSSVDLSEFLKTQDSSGLFFVNVQGFDPATNSNDGPSDKRFILATDLGILVKKDNSNKHSVFVMSIKNGRPVANAKVEILGINGIPVLTQYTNEQGCAVFNKVEGYSREKQPVAYVVTSGSDISFMPFGRYDRSVDYSKFNVSGEYSSNREKGMKAFIFSDRGIYRPGDDINLGVIVRNFDWSNVSGIPVKIVLKDPYSKTVFEKTVTLNSSGFFSIDAIPTQNVFPTGTYTAIAYLVKDDKKEFMLGSESIRIEEFRTDTLKISAKIAGSSGNGWALPENLRAVISLSNFFGTPAQDRMIKAEFTVSPTEFRFPKFQEYRFPDPFKRDDRNAIQSVSESFPNARSDENGEASHDFDLSKFAGGTYNLILSAEGFEGDSGKSVSAYDSVKMSPYKYLLGFKSASKLSYLNKDASAVIDLIAVDNNLKTIDLKNLKVRMMQIQYISSLVKQNSGVYKYQTITKENLVEEKDFEVSSNGSRVNLNTSNPGNYVIEITDSNGMKILSVPFFIAGASNQSFSIEKDANLMVNLQNDDVEPGRQITLNITAPYSGAGLITIEKDKVYAYKWFRTDSNSTVQTITVPEDIEGNGYINVSFIRSMDSREIFSSPHSYAVVPFRISLAKRTVKIDLNSKETARPGDELEISYKTSRNSKIIVYAVDEGILQVAQYRTPNPLNFFFRKGALEIETFQTVDMILPDYKIIREIAGIGGGEGFDMIERNLNPFSRKQHKPVVFWSTMIDSTTEYKTVKYTIPDYFNGSLRIMAVAANPEQFGSAEREVIVKSPVIILPMAPLAAIAGDTFEVSATVSNNIEGSKSASLEVWLESNDKFEITGTNNQTIEVKEGGEKIVRFNLKTNDKLGSGDLTFRAKHKNEVFKANVSVSVRPAFAYRTSINSGISKNSKTKVDGFARNMYDEYARREISASYSPQLLFRTLRQYFEKYPYGCTEQIISGTFPFLYSATSERKGFITPQEQQELFNHTLSRIRSRQLSNGSFALWPEAAQTHAYATLYALHFFTDAKDLGYPVPNEILSRGRNWLENFASDLPTSFEDARLKAYANYILTRNNAVTTNNLLRIEDYLNSNHKKWKEDIVSAYLASCYAMLKDFKKADELIKSFKPDAKEKFIFYSDYDSSSQRNATYLYLCNKHFPNNLNPDAQSIADGLIKVLADGKFNTISSAKTLLALLSFGKSEEGKDANIKISVKGKDGKERELSLNADPFPFSKFDSEANSFNISANENLGKIYYSVLQQGYDRTLKEYAEGVEISREYLDSNGVAIKSANVGDTITVRIRARTKSSDYLTAVIVDLLPASFEIISGSQSGPFSSSDAREDRMVFYATIGKNISEFTYNVKVVTKGNFTIPGIYITGLYDTEISAMTKQSKIEITHPNN